MILVDTSIWIDHLRRANDTLVRRLNRLEIAIHPLVIGELAMGNLGRRALLQDFWLLPAVEAVDDREVISFVEREQLYGRGIGLIDAHLLASCRQSNHLLWTADRRLAGIAAELDLALTG